MDRPSREEADGAARRVASLAELSRRLREIGWSAGRDEVAQAAVRAARWALQADISWCGLRDGDALVMGGYENLHPSMADVWRLPVSQGIGGRVAATGRTLRAADYLHDARRLPVLKSLIDDAGVRGCLCAPLTGDGVVYGVLYVADRRPRAFSDQEAELATLIAEHAGETLSRLDRQAAVETETAALEQAIAQARAARDDLREIADVLADANDAVAGLRLLASRLGVEVRLHDQFGNLLGKAGDVLGSVQLRVPLSPEPSDLGELEVIADAPLPPGSVELVQQTAPLIVLQMLRERSGLEAELHLHSEFFSGLLAGRLEGDPEALLRQASQLGLDLREPMAVVCVGVHQDGPPAPGTRAAPTRMTRQAVERAAREQFRRPVVSLRGDEIVVVAEVDDRDEAALQEHVATLAQRASRAGATPLSAGIGRICTALGDYPEAYYQAAMALSVAVRRPEPGAVVTPADLGPYGLFGHGASRQSLQAIVDQALGPLIEADARTGSEYVKTLDAFLGNDRHLERAAKALHVHVNTVRYRLNRIHEISAIDLHDVESRFLVELALRARAALPDVGEHAAAPAPETSQPQAS